MVFRADLEGSYFFLNSIFNTPSIHVITTIGLNGQVGFEWEKQDKFKELLEDRSIYVCMQYRKRKILKLLYSTQEIAATLIPLAAP